jgi:hypothetical protein
LPSGSHFLGFLKHSTHFFPEFQSRLHLAAAPYIQIFIGHNSILLPPRWNPLAFSLNLLLLTWSQSSQLLLSTFSFVQSRAYNITHCPPPPFLSPWNQSLNSFYLTPHSVPSPCHSALWTNDTKQVS